MMGTGLAGSHLYGPDPGSQFSLPPTSWAPAHLCPGGSAAPCPPSDLPVHEKPRGAHRWELRQPENRAQSPADTFLPAVRWGGKPRGAQQHPSALPRVRVSRTFSVSAQPPAPAPGAPRWLGSQSLRRPRVQDRRTTCGWPTPPASRGLRWARRGLPGAASTPSAPGSAPGAHPPPRGPIPTAGGPCRPGRSLAPGSRYFGQTPKPPRPSAWTRTRVPRKASPRVLERCHPTPARLCHALPNLSATSLLPDISGPLSPQQQFEAGQAPRDGFGPGAPSPAAGGPAGAVAHLLYAPAPSLGAAAAPPGHQLPPRPRRRPRRSRVSRGRTLTRGRRQVPAPLGCSPGRGGEAGPRPTPSAAARPARLVAPSAAELSGERCRAESGGRRRNNDPLARAPRRGLRAALRAAGRGCGLLPGAPSARSAKCTPQAWRPRPPRLLRPRCPPHSLLRRSPSLPRTLRSPPPRLQATPPPSRPAAILTPEWPEVPSPQHTSTRWRGELGGARC